MQTFHARSVENILIQYEYYGKQCSWIHLKSMLFYTLFIRYNFIFFYFNSSCCCYCCSIWFLVLLLAIGYEQVSSYSMTNLKFQKRFKPTDRFSSMIDHITNSPKNNCSLPTPPPTGSIRDFDRFENANKVVQLFSFFVFFSYTMEFH